MLSLIILTVLIFGRVTRNSNTLSWKELTGDATPRKECKMALDLVVLVLFFTLDERQPDKATEKLRKYAYL